MLVCASSFSAFVAFLYGYLTPQLRDVLLTKGVELLAVRHTSELLILRIGDHVLVVLVMMLLAIYELRLKSYRKRAEWKLRKSLGAETRSVNLLLHSVIPTHIVRKLQESGDGGAVVGEERTVVCLFGDIAGFTPLSAKLKPIQLVKILHEIYGDFDDLVIKYGMFKMDTIGAPPQPPARVVK